MTCCGARHAATRGRAKRSRCACRRIFGWGGGGGQPALLARSRCATSTGCRRSTHCVLPSLPCYTGACAARAGAEAPGRRGAREQAAAALVALSDKKLVMTTEGQKHVMLSYQWSTQSTIARLNESLIARGYVTWFDLTNMKGSTMDAMSDAIEGADVMLYGVSLAYKESANCRLEAVSFWA